MKGSTGTSKKVAIIGFGGMGQRHYSAYQKAGISIAAICDMNKDIISRILPDYPEEKIYTSYQDLFSNEDLDGVSIVTNGPSHADIAIQASESGIPNILCEKPIATSLQDALRLISTCEKNSTRLSINLIRRWSPNYLSLKKEIDNGLIGDIRHLYFNCGSTGLGNFAIHFFDTARMLTGSEPDWVIGITDKTGTPNPRGKQFSDPGGYGIVHFANGVRMYVDTSEDTGIQYTFQVVGTYGRIVIDEWNNTWQINRRDPGLRDIPLTRYNTDMDRVPFQSETHDIVDLTSRGIQELLSGAPLSCTGMDGLRSLEVIIGFHVSDDEDNHKIALPLAGTYYDKKVIIA